MNISRIAFRNQPVMFLVTFLGIIYGVSSYFSLPAREDPKITIREAVVKTLHPGLPAEEVEEYITKPLEEQIRALGEVEKISSTSMRGQSLIHVEIQDRYFSLDQIWDEVREQLEAARPQLPPGTQAPLLNDDFGDVAVVTVALTADEFSQAEQLEVAEHIRARLYAVPGTRRVQLLGVQPQRIYIDLPEARLAELGLSPKELAAQLQSRNVLPPAGILESGEQRFALEVTGEFLDINQLAEYEIILPDGRGALRLGDLGIVRRGHEEPVQQSAFFNGRKAIVLAVSMLDGYSVMDYGESVTRVLHSLEQELPAGYQLEVMTFQAEQVAKAVFGVSINVLQTLLIVLGVVIVFLGVRTGLIVGSIVPIVMLVTLAIMSFTGVSLERMSLATLIIALGLLVDNAIVVAEDFKTRVESGISRDEALGQTGGELAIPLLSSTLTTVLVFLPLMLAEHVAGEYTRSISIVIAISLLVSWLLSLTITPVLCHRFLSMAGSNRGGSGSGLSDRIFVRMTGGYEFLLRRVMGKRPLFLSIMVAALVSGVGLMKVLPKKFFPDSDRNQVLIYIDFPSGVAAAETERRIQAISDSLATTPGIAEKLDGIAAYGGFGGPRFVLSLTPLDPAPNKGFMVLRVLRSEDMESVLTGTRRVLESHFPDISAQVTRMFLGPSDSGVLEVQVKGPDREVLYATAAEVEHVLSAVPGAVSIKQSWEARTPALRVEVDQARARNAGITTGDIAESLQHAISGYSLSQFREGDEVIPIVMRYQEGERESLQRLRTLSIYSRNPPSGGIPLNQVADIELVSGYSRIDREDLVRTITVQSRNSLMTAEDMVVHVENKLKGLEADLPPGHWIEFDGVVTVSAEARGALQASLPLCLGVIFIILVMQFNSFARPLIIVTTIPLVIVGVSLGLLTTGASFGFMVLLGIYSLAGIIINNAIVLIDRIDLELQASDKAVQEAIICASVRRLRPIVMSSVTTILGFLPLIISRDPLFYGMASAMAFGLALGTIMSLGVVPVLYSYFIGYGVDSFKTGSNKLGAAEL